ncbi:class I SAM-dependent methyltransferase [Actinosynnema sp. NPDC023587]|uniref:class I SAM-dependent methyltransferase n=1 Tax=Actinosynnema sp. NPDC023587 TaxID=3154695 RepID=UPI0033C30776
MITDPPDLPDDGAARGNGPVPPVSTFAQRPTSPMSSAPRPIQVDLLRRNGPLWFAHHLLAVTAQAVAARNLARSRALEERYGLPGTNTVRVNRTVWQRWDWSNGGREWTPSTEWQTALVEEFVLAHPESAGTVLEVGPGGGRWTVPLAGRARDVVLVDIAPAVLEHCWRLLGSAVRAEYVLTDGRSLPGVPDRTVDFVFSFDCFVHVAPADFAAYAAEFARVVRDGGVLVLHHPDRRTGRGWRSALTTEHVRSALTAQGFAVLRVCDRWGSHGQFGVDGYRDAITVARKKPVGRTETDG